MDKVFLNFPVSLLKPAFSSMRQVCDDIINYSCFKHSEILHGSPTKRMTDSAFNHYGIKLGNVSKSFERGKMLYQTTPEKTAMTGISKSLLFEYYQNDKTDFEIALLLSFLAIKSILGKKSYCRITTDYLLCRMAGYTSKSEITELPANLKIYLTRRKMDSLKIELRNSFGLKIYGRYTRGFFVSFELPIEQLIKEVEMKRKRYIEKTQRGEQSKAVKKVLTELYLTNTI